MDRPAEGISGETGAASAGKGRALEWWLSLLVCLSLIPGWYGGVAFDPAFPSNYRGYLFILIFISGPPLFIALLFLRTRFRMMGLYIVPAGTLLRILVLGLIFFSFDDAGIRNSALMVFLIGIGAFLIFEVASALWVGFLGRG